MASLLRRCVQFALAVALLIAGSEIVRGEGRSGAGVVASEPAFDFGRVVRGEPVEHGFILRNDGNAPVRVVRAMMTPPLLVSRMPGLIAPGETAHIAARLDTAELQGPFSGDLVVQFDDVSQPEIALLLEGEVVGPIEVSPMPAVFIVGQRGRGAEGTLELINHETEPLQILGIEHSPEAFSTALEALVPGQRYRLTVTLLPDGPGSRRSEPIVIHTSSDTTPLVRIAAQTYLRDRVYVFPEAVDLGSFRLEQVTTEPGVLARLEQTLMVYQSEGTDFEAHLDTDVPGLQLISERGPRRDRYQVTVRLTPDEIRAGELSGSIRIRTNDPEFSELRVPVHGRITSP